MNMDMKKYGLTDRFMALSGMYPEYAAGRITSQEKGVYQLVTDKGEKPAEVSGKFRYSHRYSHRGFTGSICCAG